MLDRDISQDDIQDVTEMTNKLENYISSVLANNELDLAMSALMSATINSIIAQSKTVGEIVHYRNAMLKIIDSAIHEIRSKF